MPKSKQTVVSFRVDEHLAEVLDRMPDKSNFIRRAIMDRLYTSCPCCQGHGVMPTEIATWLETQLPSGPKVTCRCCGFTYPVELVTDELSTPTAPTFVCRHCRDHSHGA